MSKRVSSIFLMAAILLVGAARAWAANYYVMDTIAESGVTAEEAQITTQLVKSSVSSRSNDIVTENQYEADYALQPRLLRLGSNYILTVEKKIGDEVLFAAQTKLSRIEQLDSSARSVTIAAINEPSRQLQRRGIASEPAPAVPYHVQTPTTRSGTTTPPVIIAVPPAEAQSTTPIVDVLPNRKVGYWTLGVGSFIPRQLETDSLMYNFTVGHIWDINPRAAVKAIGEASLSSGDEGARFFNLGVGSSFFLPGAADNAPYLTADIGYGYAEDATDDTAEGFSFGTGVGFQFFRTTETTLDLLLRYSVILDVIDNGEGSPSVIGLRLAVNF